mgnify:CR=1 FL=1
MSTDAYKDLLTDIVKEINEIAMDKGIGGDSDFDRGYRAGMMVVMKAVQDEIRAFGLSDSIELIDVDEWFRSGKDYVPTRS